MDQKFIPADLKLIVPYGDMVAQLFKVGKDLGNFAGNAMHAAIGMTGEAGELLLAKNRVDLLLELGDFEFYREAFIQQFEGNRSALFYSVAPNGGQTLLGSLNGLQLGTTLLLDVVKKSWVYGQEWNLGRLTDVTVAIESNLLAIYEFIGVPREAVLFLNQQKLIGPNGRYPSGKYSDEQARARADMAGREDDAPGGKAAE